jgi:hypothetical protein
MWKENGSRPWPGATESLQSLLLRRDCVEIGLLAVAAVTAGEDSRPVGADSARLRRHDAFAQRGCLASRQDRAGDWQKAVDDSLLA